MRMRKDLEGEPSPWETRATCRWKRRWVATDSSAEQSPEVNCLTEAVLTAASGNGRRRRRHRLRCGGGASGTASVARLIKAPPALQGRSRRATPRGLRVTGRCTPGTGPAGSPGGSNSPFGDVGVRLGGSEHHQGRAPTLRSCRATPVASGRHRQPRPAEADRAPRGTAGDLGRRAVRTGSRPSSEGRWTTLPTAPARRGERRSQRPRPAAMRRVANGLGPRRRTAPDRVSARHGAGLRRWPRLPEDGRSAPAGHVRARGAGSNGTRATAAVMRYGC
jgi:hypothetical protein